MKQDTTQRFLLLYRPRVLDHMSGPELAPEEWAFLQGIGPENASAAAAASERSCIAQMQ
jgi:hypothetical protein